MRTASASRFTCRACPLCPPKASRLQSERASELFRTDRFVCNQIAHVKRLPLGARPQNLVLQEEQQDQTNLTQVRCRIRPRHLNPRARPPTVTALNATNQARQQTHDQQTTLSGKTDQCSQQYSDLLVGACTVLRPCVQPLSARAMSDAATCARHQLPLSRSPAAALPGSAGKYGPDALLSDVPGIRVLRLLLHSGGVLCYCLRLRRSHIKSQPVLCKSAPKHVSAMPPVLSADLAERNGG